MNELDRLGKIWDGVFVDGNNSNSRMRMTDYGAILNVGAKGISFFTRQDRFWTRFLNFLDPKKELHILITAMAMGCELYDAARIAKTIGCDNVHFYGHDISPYFTAIAADGIYPQRAVDIVPQADRWFQTYKLFDGYVQIKGEQFKNAHILKPCDITKLKGKFDVVVSNIINPTPKGYLWALRRRARHLVISDDQVNRMSDEFSEIGNRFFGNCVRDLKGDQVKISIPEIYKQQKSPEYIPGLIVNGYV